MDIDSTKLTVFFEAPFWIGVFERIERRKLSVCKVVFGAEPKDYEVWEYRFIEKEALHAMMAVLTEKQRNLIYQNYVLDKTHQEIADGMEIARGSVTRSVNQALERIRRKFDFEAHYELAVGDFT